MIEIIINVSHKIEISGSFDSFSSHFQRTQWK